MKKLIVGALASLSLAAPAVAPAVAQASPINECGSAEYGVVYNITTRHVSCHDARSFARKIVNNTTFGFQHTNHSFWMGFPGWHPYWVTNHVFANGSQADLRAVHGWFVIRFQYSLGDY